MFNLLFLVYQNPKNVRLFIYSLHIAFICFHVKWIMVDFGIDQLKKISKTLRFPSSLWEPGGFS